MGVLAFLLRAEWLAIFLAGVVVYLDFGGQPLLLPFPRYAPGPHRSRLTRQRSAASASSLL